MENDYEKQIDAIRQSLKQQYDLPRMDEVPEIPHHALEILNLAYPDGLPFNSKKLEDLPEITKGEILAAYQKPIIELETAFQDPEEVFHNYKQYIEKSVTNGFNNVMDNYKRLLESPPEPLIELANKIQEAGGFGAMEPMQEPPKDSLIHFNRIEVLDSFEIGNWEYEKVLSKGKVTYSRTKRISCCLRHSEEITETDFYRLKN